MRSLKPGDIERLVADATSGKTSCDEKNKFGYRIFVGGGEADAHKAAVDLSAVFCFALRREPVANNPVKMLPFGEPIIEGHDFLRRM